MGRVWGKGREAGWENEGARFINMHPDRAFPAVARSPLRQVGSHAVFAHGGLVRAAGAHPSHGRRVYRAHAAHTEFFQFNARSGTMSDE